jgi:hypothetical protein
MKTTEQIGFDFGEPLNPVQVLLSASHRCECDPVAKWKCIRAALYLTDRDSYTRQRGQK